MNVEIINKEVIKKLKENGFKRIHTNAKQEIIVEQSDAIKVLIRHHLVRPKFPEIGNMFQIVVTSILAVILFFLPLNLGIWIWVIAILGGQLASFLFYYPQLKRLQKQVEQAIHD